MAGKIKGITIEIGGDTTKLDKALKNVNNTSRDLTSQLKDINKSLKFNPGNTELIAQKQRVLSEAVGNTKDKLNTLKEAHKQASEQLSKGKIGKDAFDELTREIIKTENELKSFQGQFNKINFENSGFGKISKILKDGSENLQKFADKAKKVGTDVSKVLTTSVVAVGKLSIDAFKEVDEGLDIIVSKTGATGEPLEQMNKSLEKLATSIPASFGEVGNAVGEVNTQFGLLGDDLENISEYAIKFAKINATDVTQSIINAKGAMEQYRLSAKDIPMILDSVTKTAQNTGVNVDTLFDIVKKGSPQIKAMGLNFSQGVELMGRFEQKGMDSAKALSYMSKAQIVFAKNGVSLTDGLKKLEENLSKARTEQEKLTIASELFGTKGAAFMLNALQQGALDSKAFANATQDALGSVSNTFEGMKDPIDDLQPAINDIKLAFAELGSVGQNVIVPMFKGLAEKIKSFTQWFKNLSDTQKEMIVKIGLIVGALGPLIFILGTLASSIASIISVVSSFSAVLGSFGALTGVLGAVGSALGSLGGGR